MWMPNSTMPTCNDNAKTNALPQEPTTSRTQPWEEQKRHNAPILQQDLLGARQITHAHRIIIAEKKSQCWNMHKPEGGRRTEGKMDQNDAQDGGNMTELRLRPKKFQYQYRPIIRTALKDRLRQQENQRCQNMQRQKTNLPEQMTRTKPPKQKNNQPHITIQPPAKEQEQKPRGNLDNKSKSN